MRIGILQTAYKKSEDYGAFYNVQELGLARALAATGHEVILYKAVDGKARSYTELDGKLAINLVSVRYLGINGLIDSNKFDTSLQVLIYFSDTQLKVPAVYKWCQVNKIQLIPYIGVLESHSENRIKRFIMDRAVNRNIKVYRKCKLLAKTPAVSDKLKEMGCNQVNLFPVGLDESVMNDESLMNNADSLQAPTLLFIGRMEEEKQPLEMVRMYGELLRENKKVRLIMIGDGYMYEQVSVLLDKTIKEHCLSDKQASIIRKVPYNQMHSYYKEADLYVNLNQVEILGMSILEAMYYECPVLAIDAPGPHFILKDDSGMIAPGMEDLLEVLKLFVKGQIDQEELERLTKIAKDRVKSDFVWSALAGRLIEIINAGEQS